MANVLIVDDEVDICEIISEYVQEVSPDAKISIANDGLDAFVTTTKDTFDLIVTDMKMPFLNGKDFILALRTKENQNTATPVIMLSGFLNKETIVKLEEKGILCLNKPIDSEIFTDLIKKALTA